MEQEKTDFTDVIHLRGAIRIALCDADSGRILEERHINNLLVTAGRAWALGQLITAVHITSQNISHFAIGSSTNAPTTGDTGLNLEVVRKAIDSFVTLGLTNNPPSWSAIISFATNQGNTTLAEAGLFNSSSTGTMLGHATYASFTKATSNTLNFTYTISG